MLPNALRLLHYSPEPLVIRRAIESAIYLGHDDIAKAHMARYRVAFPREWDEWRTKSAHLLQRN